MRLRQILLATATASIVAFATMPASSQTVRYANQGGRPITDIAVTDSLSPRLEYVPGSSEADRDAVFTTQENEAGSLILRWEISGQLQGGDSGVIRFKARVR